MEKLKFDEENKRIKAAFRDIHRKLLDVTIDDEIVGEPDWDNLADEKSPLVRRWLNLSDDDSLLKKLNEKLENSYNNEYDRIARYTRLQKASKHSEVKGALTIQADEALSQDSNGNIFNIHCSDNEVIEIIEDMIGRVGLEDGTKSWQHIYNMCLFGDEFNEVVIARNKRMIHSIRYIPREMLIRVEKNNVLQHFKVNSNFAQANQQYYELINASIKNKKEIIDPFRILHWKIDSTTYYPYGESVIDAVLPVIEELQLMEKALVIARIVRSPERRIYNVNVGQAQGMDVIKYANEIVKNMKRKKILDGFNSNRYDEQNDFFSGTEDLVIPRRAGEEPNTVDTLPQLNVAPPDDLEWVRDRLFPGLQVPRQYLFDDTFTNANVNLSNKSVRFAKFIRRIQKFYLYNIYKLAIIELRLRGLNKSRYEDLQITMNNPSNLDELQKLELENQRWSITTTIKSLNSDPLNPMVSDYNIFKTIFNKGDSEILDIMKMAKAQGKGLNIFQFLPKDQRPEGYEILDQIAAMQSVVPAEPGMEVPTDAGGIPPDVSGALGEPTEPAPEEEVTPPESATETPPEAAPDETTVPPEEVVNADVESDSNGKAIYTEEDKLKKLKERAMAKKNKYKQKKAGRIVGVYQEDLLLVDKKKDEFSKFTKLNKSLEYVENCGDFGKLKLFLHNAKGNDE